jgi:hypothetical protein
VCTKLYYRQPQVAHYGCNTRYSLLTKSVNLTNIQYACCHYNHTLPLTAVTGDGLKRIDFRTLTWDVAFAQYVKQLETEKHVIFAGDLNAAHEVILVCMITLVHSMHATCVAVLIA